MDFSKARFIDVDGIRTRYFDAGEGETVVLFHGGNFGSPHGADCAADWNLNFDGLSEQCRVIAVDKIGQGYTDNPRTDEEYTMQSVVRHALRFLEVLGVGDCHIVGHSRGAYLTCRMTLEDPSRIKSNIMVDTATLGPGQGRNHIVFADTPQPFLSRESQRWVMERYSYNPKCVTEDWLDELMRVVALPKYQESVEKMEGQGLEKRVFLPSHGRQKADTFDLLMERGTGRPNLLVWGLNDPTATIDQGFVLFDMVSHREPRTEMHVFNESGHFTYREHPKAFNRLVLDYITNL
ncbi:MAG: alpha/beta fold hydrolase [Pseudomonadota bacterium]|nr:alpha/beta fold hydrolase [Pseudomonadota bacterium]